jgi:dipeptidase
MRDHFEGTEFDMTKGVAAGPYGCPYRWKGLTWKLDGDTATSYGWERPISTQQTAFSQVAQMRSWLPRQVGGVYWYGVDDNYSNVYIPLYCCLTEAPKAFAGYSISQFSLNSGFWVFNLVANLAYTKYNHVIKDIQAVQGELENKFFAYQPVVEKAALELNSTSPDLMVKYLSEYSLSQAQITVDRWRSLWEQLVMKYNDGYINDVNVNNGRTPKSSGYSQEFFKSAVKDRPGYYEVKWRDKPISGTGSSNASDKLIDQK